MIGSSKPILTSANNKERLFQTAYALAYVACE